MTTDEPGEDAAGRRRASRASRRTPTPTTPGLDLARSSPGRSAGAARRRRARSAGAARRGGRQGQAAAPARTPTTATRRPSTPRSAGWSPTRAGRSTSRCTASSAAGPDSSATRSRSTARPVVRRRQAPGADRLDRLGHPAAAAGAHPGTPAQRGARARLGDPDRGARGRTCRPGRRAALGPRRPRPAGHLRLTAVRPAGSTADVRPESCGPRGRMGTHPTPSSRGLEALSGQRHVSVPVPPIPRAGDVVSGPLSG